MYGEVLYLEFYSVFSEQFINDEILLCKTVNVRIPVKMESHANDIGVVNFNIYIENKYSILIFTEITPEYFNKQVDLWKLSTWPVQLVKD